MTDSTVPREDGPAMKPNGLYVPLDVDFAADDKLCECSVEAEHVFIRSLALCKRTLSDGTVTMSQLRRECEKLDRAQLDAAVIELLDVGLFDRLGMDRMVLPSWLKRNPSKALLADKRAKSELKSKLGNHKRWHVNQNAPDPTCELCFPTSGDVSHWESHEESHSDSISEGKGSEGKTEVREDRRKPEVSEKETNHHQSTSDSRPVDNSPLGVVGRILKNAGYQKPKPTDGEAALVARALKRGWSTTQLEDLGIEAGIKATTDPRAYMLKGLTRCANTDAPLDFKDPQEYLKHLKRLNGEIA